MGAFEVTWGVRVWVRCRRAAAAGTAAAAVVVLGVAGVAGCGAGGHGGPGAAAGSPSTPLVIVTSDLLPDPTVPDDTADDPEATADGQINAAATAHGWDYQDYDDAAALVQDVCDTLDDDSTDSEDNSFSPGQWVATAGYNGAERHLISYGVPLLCPQWKSTVASAWAGTYPVWMSAGTYKVTSKPGDDHVRPGTYRTTGEVSDCYWERSTAGGDTIDNRFITAATRVTVTIRASDALFTSRDCGIWKPVH